MSELKTLVDGLLFELQKSHVKTYTRATKTGKMVQVKEHDDKRTKKTPAKPVAKPLKVLPQSPPKRKVEASPVVNSALGSDEIVQRFDSERFEYEGYKEWERILDALPRVDPLIPNSKLKRPAGFSFAPASAQRNWRVLSKLVVDNVFDSPKLKVTLEKIKQKNDSDMQDYRAKEEAKRRVRLAAKAKALDVQVGTTIHNGEEKTVIQRIPSTHINFYNWNKSGAPDNPNTGKFSGGDYRLSETVTSSYGGGMFAIIATAPKAKAHILGHLQPRIEKIKAAGFENVRVVYENTPPGDGAPGTMEGLIIFDKPKEEEPKKKAARKR